jgi:hypothetical protein
MFLSFDTIQMLKFLDVVYYMDLGKQGYLDAQRRWNGCRHISRNIRSSYPSRAHGEHLLYLRARSLLKSPNDSKYILANLGMSTNFGVVDLDHLTFPAHMRIDYIRVYQPADSINIGCDPVDFPTEAYLNA